MTTPRISGSIIHRMMERLSHAIEDAGHTWQDVPQTFLIDCIDRIAEEEMALVKAGIDNFSGRQYWLLMRLKKATVESATMLAMHLKNSAFLPLGYEIAFKEGQKYTPLRLNIDGRTVNLRGVIDRGDIYVDDKGNRFVRVVDYKTYNAQFSLPEFCYGLSLQLVLYLDRLCESENANPAGMLYFRLYDPILETQDDRSQKHRMNGLVLDDEKILKQMDKTLGAPETLLPIRTKKDGGLYASQSAVSKEQFAMVRKQMQRAVYALSRSITSGNTAPVPFRTKTKTACQLCDFAPVCLFDAGCGGKYKQIALSSNQAMENIMQENK